MIIGLCGQAGSGKDTVADFLVRDHSFVKVALADPLKRICKDVFAFTDEQLWGPSAERNKPDKRYPRSDRFTYPTAPPRSIWLPIDDAHTLIDEDDLAVVLEHKWCINRKEQGKRTAYVRRTTDSLKLHQLIMGEAPEGMVIDHVNGDGLDNRRKNLRYCTHAENHANEEKRRGGTSVFKGVGLDTDRNKWSAKLTAFGKTKNLGRFDTEEEAAVAYDTEARKVFGDFARLNSEMFLTPRYALQQLGTEYGRNCYPNVWVDYALRVARILKDGGFYYDAKSGVRFLSQFESQLDWVKPKTDVVISDVRFLNEIDAIRAAGGIVWKINRPGAGLQGASAQHASETEQLLIPPEKFYSVIDNNATLDDLRSLVGLVLERSRR